MRSGFIWLKKKTRREDHSRGTACREIAVPTGRTAAEIEISSPAHIEKTRALQYGHP